MKEIVLVFMVYVVAVLVSLSAAEFLSGDYRRAMQYDRDVQPLWQLEVDEMRNSREDM